MSANTVAEFAPSSLPAAAQHLSPSAWLVLIAFTLSLYVFHLGSDRTFTGHECYVAEAAREMLRTGDWIVPRIGGQPWLEKPPLPHWIVAAEGGLVGGVDEFTARLPSAIAGLLGVLIVAALAARWFGPTHGLLTGLIQATTVYTTTYARLAESDIYLWLIVLGCLALFAWHNVAPATPARQRWQVAFFMLLGLTQLVKGPMFGAVIALLPCVGFAALSRKAATWRWFFSWPGILLCVAISVAWPAAILVQYPEARDLWWLHTFGRFGAECLNPHPWWYYAGTIPWQLLPWTLLVLPALPASWRRARQESASPDRFLWLWFVLPLVVLSATKAKHHHYLIYSLPPCSFWAASGLLRMGSLCEWLARRARTGWAIWVTSGVVAVAVVCVARPSLGPFFRPALALTGLLLAGSAIGVWGLAHRQLRVVLGSMFVSCWCVYGVVNSTLLKQTDRFRDETKFLCRLNMRSAEGAHLLVYAYDPARILLYCHLPLERFDDVEPLRTRWDELSDPYLVTTVGQSTMLQRFAELIRVDQVPQGRWEKEGPYTQLALFRLRWLRPSSQRPNGEQAARQP